MKVAKLIAIAAALATTTPGAFAADGTITFTGRVTAQTCTISGNGGTHDFTVTLPTVSTSSLAAAGAIAGRTPFSIRLSGCEPDAGNVSVYFEPGATIDNATGRLSNTAATTPAGNLQVGVLNADYSNIALGSAHASQNSQQAAITSGAVTLNYFAQYVASGGAATAGNVNTSATYSIVYP